MKNFLAVFTALLFLSAAVTSSGLPHEPKPSEHPDQKEYQEQMKELGEELSTIIMENIMRVLEKEVARLKMDRKTLDEEQRQRIEAFEENVNHHPNDPAAHMALGEVYDDAHDGAGAILHTLQAEALFVAKKDIRGTAEARRNLRHYFEKYDFKPEDFILSK